MSTSVDSLVAKMILKKVLQLLLCFSELKEFLMSKRILMASWSGTFHVVKLEVKELRSCQPQKEPVKWKTIKNTET